MNVILINEKTGTSKNFRVSSMMLLLFSLIGAGLVGATVLWFSNEISNGALIHSVQYGVADLKQEVSKQRRLIRSNKDHAEQYLQALTMQMAEIQARIIRLDALGDRLVDVAGLPSDEFEFSQIPGIGGPSDTSASNNTVSPDVITKLDNLLYQLELREEKIAVLEKLIRGDQLFSDSFVAGVPVERGWRSSNFGRRTDPFTGRLAWHKGVDFAGKHGSNVLAVAGGVVIWSAPRSGYGNLVEINHGGGYVTRYGHNSKNLVKVGEVVHKGSVIAQMGTTGRSTGPHVHFEVVKNGKQVNPAKYIARSNLKP